MITFSKDLISKNKEEIIYAFYNNNDISVTKYVMKFQATINPMKLPNNDQDAMTRQDPCHQDSRMHGWVLRNGKYDCVKEDACAEGYTAQKISLHQNSKHLG